MLIATGMMAACLAVHQVPYPPPIIIDLTVTPNREPPPFRLQHVLSWWPIRAGAFVIGISTLMHVITSLAGLSNWQQWVVAIVAPTLGLTAWYSYSVQYLNYHPGSINEWGHIQIGLIGFTIGFAIVAFVTAQRGMTANQHVLQTQDGTEPSIARENAT